MRIIHVITGRVRRTSSLQIDNQLFVLQYRGEEIAETDVFIHDVPWRDATGAKGITHVFITKRVFLAISTLLYCASLHRNSYL